MTFQKAKIPALPEIALADAERYFLELLRLLAENPHTLDHLTPNECRATGYCLPQNGPSGCVILAMADNQSRYTVGIGGDQFKTKAEKVRIVENCFLSGLTQDCPYFGYLAGRRK
jgi:hypothetical protein